MSRSWLAAAVALGVVLGCSDDWPYRNRDAALDRAASDVTVGDLGVGDVTATEGGRADTGGADSSALDVPRTDVPPLDTGRVDAGTDLGTMDLPGSDVVSTDAGRMDVPSLDAARDAPRVDGGTPSCPDPGEHGCATVLVAGGTFDMGQSVLGAAFHTSPVQHRISVSTLRIDAYEVTVARFRRFWLDGHPEPTGTIPYPGGRMLPWSGSVRDPSAFSGESNCNFTVALGSREHHPANCVTYQTALAFCVWDGGRLPTGAEWEYVARGRTAGGLTPGRTYPWGDTPPNTACGSDLHWAPCAPGSPPRTARVGSKDPAGGVYDLAGNVSEWTADTFVEYTDSRCWGDVVRTDPLCVLMFDDALAVSVASRGGSFTTDSVRVGWIHSASRFDSGPWNAVDGAGFRCARSP